LPNHLQYLGPGACAAAACHGGEGAPGTKGSEYATWVSHDKHARAYEVLFQPKSAIMMKLLGRTNAHSDRQCLHGHVDGQRDTAPVPEVLARDGVSCESCHGPGAKWQGEHHKPSWRELSQEDKLSLGMRDTKTLSGRVRLCLDCHVGSARA